MRKNCILHEICGRRGIFKSGQRYEKQQETADKIFEGLLYTVIAMSFTGTSRPANGTEHIISHYVECKQLLDGITPNYHGEDVDVATLIVFKVV